MSDNRILLKFCIICFIVNIHIGIDILKSNYFNVLIKILIELFIERKQCSNLSEMQYSKVELF